MQAALLSGLLLAASVPASSGDVRHASSHLSYTSPLQDGFPAAWYNSLRPTQSSESTYFATNTHGFGHMGLQQIEERGIWFQGAAVFSIWDAGCNNVMDEAACPLEQQAEIIECGEMAKCSRFGNEGTGYKSIIRFSEWGLEQSYGFLVQAFQVSQEKVRYEGYFHAPELGGWVLLGKVQVSVGGKPWYLHSKGSFVGQWDTRSGEDVRWGCFGPAFVEANGSSNTWTQITRASFSHTTGAGEDTTHVHANVTKDGRQWGMGIGGSLVKGVEQSAVLDIFQASAVPQELQLFSQLRTDGQLPGGCLGRTCTWTQIKHFVQDAFSKTSFPITAAALTVLLCACCYATCSCRPSRRMVTRVQMDEKQEQKNREPSIKSTIHIVLDVEAQQMDQRITLGKRLLHNSG